MKFQIATCNLQIFASLIVFAIVLASCTTVTKIGTTIGQATGTITAQQAESINKSAEAMEKTFKDIKSDNYRNNCKTGYKGPKNNAHHVVPCTSLRMSLITYLKGKPPEYKRALAFFTNWDVNAGTNLLNS